MKGRWISYSAEELAFLEERRQMPRRDLHAAFVSAFGRDDVSVENLKRLCFRKGWPTGRTGCFEKGIVPLNKGKPCAPGTGGRHPNARKTQFRKGSMSGRAAQLYKPIGAERLSKEGYRERKIHDGLPMRSRWQLVQRVEWEALHGPIPAGMVLKCRDGNRLNTDPSNWEMLPRALLPRLNGRFGRGYDDAPAELKATIMAVAKLEHRVRERRQ